MVALAWTIERVMNSNGTLGFYAPWPPQFGLKDLVKDFGLFHGVVKQDKELVRDVLDNPGDGGIDMIIFGTCEIECVVSLLPYPTFMISLPWFGSGVVAWGILLNC